LTDFDIKSQLGYHYVLANLQDKRILGRYKIATLGDAHKDREEYLKRYPMYHPSKIVIWADTWGWVEAGFER